VGTRCSGGFGAGVEWRGAGGGRKRGSVPMTSAWLGLSAVFAETRFGEPALFYFDRPGTACFIYLT
jgi:hypothetical protein